MDARVKPAHDRGEAVHHRRQLTEFLAFTPQAAVARQNDPDFGEFARLRIDLDRAAMLLDDDVVADGKAKPVPSPAGLVVKNGLNIFSFTSGGIPVPLSRILISTRSPRFLVAAARVGS